MRHLGINTLFYIPGKVGGSETYLKEVVRELIPMLKCRCTLFTNRENDEELKAFLGDIHSPFGLDFEKLDIPAENRPLRIIAEQTTLAFRYRKAGCDAMWSPGYTACVAAGRRQVVSILDMQYRRFPEDLSPLARLATHILVTIGSRMCRRIVAISEFSRREVSELTGVSPEKIDVTPLGVSDSFGEVRAASFPEPYMLSVAASYPHKNLPQLIRAFDLVADRIPHRLKLAGGRGLGEGDLAAAISASPFRDRIDRLPRLPDGDLRALFKGADFFVTTSRYEGFGIPLVEAQRAAVPVIATDCASLPEVGGGSAIVFDSGDDASLAAAILRVVHMDKAERAALVARGIANSAKYTWRECARLTLESLEKATQCQ